MVVLSCLVWRYIAAANIVFARGQYDNKFVVVIPSLSENQA